MTNNAGVWIDHHKAVVVLLTEKGEDIHQILSEPDASDPSSDGAREKNSYTRNDFVAEDKRERKDAAHLQEYYDRVLASLRDAAEIVIIGPGEAKGELHKRIEAKKFKGQIAHIGTVDKMTDREIAAHVRQLLGKGSKRTQSKEA